MSIAIGKRDVARLANVLDGDFASVEEAAKAALTEAYLIYEERAKWTVVGQLMYSGGFIDHDDAAATKIALGRYGTEKQAMAAAESLVVSTRNHEEFRAWVLPVCHGTPAAYFGERAAERKALEIGRGSGLEARLQRRQEFFAANPGALVLPETIDDNTERCNACGHELATIEGNVE